MKKLFLALTMLCGMATAFVGCKPELKNVRGQVKSVEIKNDTLKSMVLAVDGQDKIVKLIDAKFQKHAFLNIEAGAQYTLGEAKFSKLLSPNIQLGLDMQKYPESKVVVTGYADAGTGNDKTNDGQTIHLYYDAMTGLFSRWKLPSEIPATTAGHISCACDIRKKTNFWDKTPCLYLRKLAILSSSRYFNVMLFS